MKFNETDKPILTVKNYSGCLVYFLLQDGEVVYVGQTAHGLSRPFSHHDKVFDEVKILFCEPEELDLIEDKYIQKYKPRYNKQSNYAVRWSLLRVRDNVRRISGCESYTVPQLKRLLKTLNIKPEKDHFNKRETISFNEYTAVLSYFLYGYAKRGD